MAPAEKLGVRIRSLPAFAEIAAPVFSMRMTLVGMMIVEMPQVIAPALAVATKLLTHWIAPSPALVEALVAMEIAFSGGEKPALA